LGSIGASRGSTLFSAGTLNSQPASAQRLMANVMAAASRGTIEFSARLMRAPSPVWQ
jgi:hypothetical protein